MSPSRLLPIFIEPPTHAGLQPHWGAGGQSFPLVPMYPRVFRRGVGASGSFGGGGGKIPINPQVFCRGIVALTSRSRMVCIIAGAAGAFEL
ncbi:unnamed protein product [Ectocarpus sp. CCAP 1310/34]|nr:unnamed protein product [Ectocarpus sp. CCAP 1310/34]